MPRLDYKKTWVGNYRHVGTIQKETVVISGGIPTGTWVNYLEDVRFARVVATTTERFKDSIVKDYNHIQLYMHRPGTGKHIIPGMRILFQDTESGVAHTYMIMGVQPPNNAQFAWKLIVKEEIPAECV